MTRAVDQAIESYSSALKGSVSRLSGYSLSPHDNSIFKKNLLVSIIDAVSRTVSNAGASNRERFTGVVAQFGDWPDHTRLSAPQLSYFLLQLRNPEFEAVRSLLQKSISRNSHGGFVELSCDPQFDDVRRVWPGSTEQKLVGSLSLSSFTHLNLLYQYRNSLIHEFREPGYGMEFHDKHQVPFYHGMTSYGEDMSAGEVTLELVYPLNFYFRLTNTIIDNVTTYLRRNRLNPYSAYEFGSSWIEELNA